MRNRCHAWRWRTHPGTSLSLWRFHFWYTPRKHSTHLIIIRHYTKKNNKIKKKTNLNENTKLQHKNYKFKDQRIVFIYRDLADIHRILVSESVLDDVVLCQYHCHQYPYQNLLLNRHSIHLLRYGSVQTVVLNRIGQCQATQHVHSDMD